MLKKNTAKVSVGLIAAAALMVSAVGCSAPQNSNTENDNSAQSAQVEKKTSSTNATAASKASFTFSDAAVTAEGESDCYEIDGTALKITAPGVYTISGACADGSISVKKGTEDVTLVLEDLSLTSSTGAPISINKTASATIDVQGTVKLVDKENPADAESADTEVADAYDGSAIHVKSEASLVITGTGSMAIDATADNDGIKAESDTKLVVGQDGDTLALSIDAADKGINGEGNVDVLGGTLSIKSQGDSIHSDYTLTVATGDTGKKAPTIEVESAGEGLEGASVIINGGDIKVKSKDDGINAANGDLTDWTYKLEINGGEIYVNADGDGIDSNGDLDVNGGTVEVFGAANSGNGAMDAGDGFMWNQNGGTVVAVGMSGMAETPANGVYVMFGSDSQIPGMPSGDFTPPEGFQPSSDEQQMPSDGQTPPEPPSGAQGVSGGSRPQQGDFQPPQGGFQQGQRPEQGQQQDAQQPGDFGNRGMMPGGDNASAFISQGSKFEIRDADGNVLYAGEGVKSADNVIFSSADIVEGQEYHLYVDGTEVASATAAKGSGQANPGFGGFGGGRMDGQFGGGSSGRSANA